MNTLLRGGFFALILCFFACQSDSLQKRKAFFERAEYNGDFMRTFSDKPFDSIIHIIKTQVPDPWKGEACEQAFYRLPANYDNALNFAFLDKIDAAFSHDSILAFTSLLRGEIFTETAQYDSVEFYLQRCWQLSIAGNRLTRAYDAENMRAASLAMRGLYPEAIEKLLKVYEYFLSIYPEDGGRLYENMEMIARTYRRAEDFESSLQWSRKLWDFFYVQRGLYASRNAQNLARAYAEAGLLDSAKLMIDSSFVLAGPLSPNSHFGIAWFFRGDITRRRGNCAAAFPDYWTAIKDIYIVTNNDMLALTERGLGRAHFCLNHLDSAAFYFKKALRTTDTVALSTIYKDLAKVYQQQGQVALALAAERESRILHDRMITVARDRKIAYIQAKSESDKRISTIEHEQQRQRLWYIIGLLSVAVGLGVSLYFLARYRQQRQLLEKEKALTETQVRLKELELKQAEKTIEEKAKALQKTEAVLQNTEQALQNTEQALQETAQILAFKEELIDKMEMRLARQKQQEEAKNADKAPETPQLNAIEMDKIIAMKENAGSMRFLTANDWQQFQDLFDARFPTYRHALNVRFAKLSKTEKHLVLLVRSGFDNQEIAAMLGVSPTSIYTSRYRLRRKLDLGEDVDLDKYIWEIA